MLADLASGASPDRMAPKHERVLLGCGSLRAMVQMEISLVIISVVSQMFINLSMLSEHGKTLSGTVLSTISSTLVSTISSKISSTISSIISLEHAVVYA